MEAESFLFSHSRICSTPSPIQMAKAKAAAGGVKSIASGEALMLAALIAGQVLVLKR